MSYWSMAWAAAIYLIVIREESEFVVMESIIRKLLILIVADFTETVSSVYYQARNVIH